MPGATLLDSITNKAKFFIEIALKYQNKQERFSNKLTEFHKYLLGIYSNILYFFPHNAGPIRELL